MRLQVTYDLKDIDLNSTSPRSLGAIKRRLADLSPAGEFVHKTMRFGEGSISAQFAAEAEFTEGGGRNAWPKTKPFGNRAAPAKTLQRSGHLMNAWLGQAAGAISESTPNSFYVGVDTALYPPAGVFQSLTPTVVRPKKPAKGGKGTAMHYFLGLTFGVWISEARLRAGLVIPPRRVAAGPVMQQRVANLLKNWIVGEGITRAEANVA